MSDTKSPIDRLVETFKTKVQEVMSGALPEDVLNEIVEEEVRRLIRVDLGPLLRREMLQWAMKRAGEWVGANLRKDSELDEELKAFSVRCIEAAGRGFAANLVQVASTSVLSGLERGAFKDLRACKSENCNAIGQVGTNCHHCGTWID